MRAVAVAVRGVPVVRAVREVPPGQRNRTCLQPYETLCILRKPVRIAQCNVLVGCCCLQQFCHETLFASKCPARHLQLLRRSCAAWLCQCPVIIAEGSTGYPSL